MSSIINVTYCQTEKVIPMGRLAFVNRKILFEYSSEFLDTRLELSPFKLPLKPGVIACPDYTFDGLFGIFNDSLPDGWGRLLLDRKLMSLGIVPENLTPLDRLRYVGTRGMGALQYQPEHSQEVPTQAQIDLDTLANECIHFETTNQELYVDDLLFMNGSSAGARPKILISINPKTGVMQVSDNQFTHPHFDWIVKFRSSVDPKDIGPIEYAYHLMAKAANIKVPEAKLFKSREGYGFFGVQRFDRTKDSFLHVHTLSGLLHADHRIPSLDYQTVMKATEVLTKNMKESEKQFRNCAFNVFAHNRDDHAKNFSFLMGANGQWTVSPAYDLTFSMGPGGEHSTTVMGNGRNPHYAELVKLALNIGIAKIKAENILDEVLQATSNWMHYAEEAGVSKISTQNIANSLSRLKKA